MFLQELHPVASEMSGWLMMIIMIRIGVVMKIISNQVKMIMMIILI